MFLNPNIFILAKPSHLIIWNYKDHVQFELTPKFYLRLFELLREPTTFDETRETDQQLIRAGIIVSQQDKQDDWGWDPLSKIYHFGTKDIPYTSPPTDVNDWAQQYAEHCRETVAKITSLPAQLECSEAVTLPTPAFHLKYPALIKTFEHRKTCRHFYANPINISTVSAILYYTLGYLPDREDSDEFVFEGYRQRRSAPSGGGLNCIGGYVYCAKVTGLPAGIYYYNPEHHSLTLRSHISDIILGDILCGQHFINELPFGIFLTAELDKLWLKYEHSRAYRMALIEAGHVSQCFQLIATALGLKTWLTGAINESPTEKLMLSKKHEHVLFFTGAGHGSGDAVPAALRSLLR